jgi:hypothetical protein
MMRKVRDILQGKTAVAVHSCQQIASFNVAHPNRQPDSEFQLMTHVGML